jgi:hypothetical protein
MKQTTDKKNEMGRAQSRTSIWVRNQLLSAASCDGFMSQLLRKVLTSRTADVQPPRRGLTQPGSGLERFAPVLLRQPLLVHVLYQTIVRKQKDLLA